MFAPAALLSSWRTVKPRMKRSSLKEVSGKRSPNIGLLQLSQNQVPPNTETESFLLNIRERPS